MTLQTEFTAEELLADHDTAEPLTAGGVRCHGGFDEECCYVSPRTRFRVPGIEAWQRKHVEEFGRDIIKGTAVDHLGRGLFEAHGRDEAGWEREAGHKDMWFAARDIAFENPTAKVDVEGMLQRMGFGAAASGGGSGSGNSALDRVLPDDVDMNLELIAALMVRVLFIEIQAFHAFAWAEAWLSDPKLVAGDGEAARLVGYIRADETPHVGYLETALTEMLEKLADDRAAGRRDPSAGILG